MAEFSMQLKAQGAPSNSDRHANICPEKEKDRKQKAGETRAYAEQKAEMNHAEKKETPNVEKRAQRANKSTEK